MKKENKFEKVIKDCEEPYKGKIKAILNKYSKAIDELDDYNFKKAVKYQRATDLIEQAMQEIKAVQDKYLETTAQQLNELQYEVEHPKVPKKTQGEQLLDAINKMNDMKLREIQLQFATDEDLMEMCNREFDSTVILQVKAELAKRGNMELAKTIEVCSDLKDLEHAKKQFAIMDANREGLLPGMEVHEKLLIDGNAKQFLQKKLEPLDDFDTKELDTTPKRELLGMEKPNGVEL